MKILVLITAVLLASAATQDLHEATSSQAEHAWLQQLVGEWTVSAEATMEPGAEPMQMESSESVRSIGGLWVLAEGSATYGGAPFTSIMTLGYDPKQEAFVGTWIDTMQPHLWSYRGKLDEARKVLTLETRGPSFGDPSASADYRDVIELKGPDHRVLSSSVKDEEGKWTTFMKAEYRRKP
jgi:hypothetical protein